MNGGSRRGKHRAHGNGKPQGKSSQMMEAGNGRRDVFNPSMDGAEVGFGVSPCSGDDLSEAEASKAKYED